jgi:hypothetical protein
MLVCSSIVVSLYACSWPPRPAVQSLCAILVQYLLLEYTFSQQLSQWVRQELFVATLGPYVSSLKWT